jgi:hypothetical protein
MGLKISNFTKVLRYFCLWNDGILYSRGAVIQRKIYVSPAFLKHDSAKKKNASTCKNRDPNMQEVGFFLLHEAAQNFVYQIYSRVKNQKKPIAQDQDPEQHLHKKEKSRSGFRSISGFKSCSVWHSVVNLPHFDADPDSTYYPDVDPDLDSFFYADSICPTFHSDSDPDPYPYLWLMDPEPYISKKNRKKNNDFYCFVTSFWHFIFEKWCECTFKKQYPVIFFQ